MYSNDSFKIIHLSDVHLKVPDDDDQWVLFEALFRSLTREAHTDPKPELVVMTGDLFDSAVLPSGFEATTARFFDGVTRAVPGTPILVIPGNHDRRRIGTLWPYRPECFAKLAQALHAHPSVTVLPFSATGALVRTIDMGGACAGVDLAALDSTRLLKGLLSSGGLVRSEDLLLLEALLPNDDPRPLFLFMHHHLVPPSVTDRNRIDSSGVNGWLRWVVNRLLGFVGWLIAKGNYEEPSMTAFGSGTALSLLHGFRRPILVLHGHKHYPIARLLIGPGDEDCDVALVGAGAAGMRENWNYNEREEMGMPIWPSFNVVTWNGAAVIERVRFSPTESNEPSAEREPLIRLRRQGQARWDRRDHAEVRHDPAPALPTVSPKFTQNRAEFELKASTNPRRYDLVCTRTAVGVVNTPPTIEEPIARPNRGTKLRIEGKESDPRLPFVVRVSSPGTIEPCRYELDAGICRTSAEANAAYSNTEGESYESVALVNRYDADIATLKLTAPFRTTGVFGSIRDLGTGTERPARITHEPPNTWTLELEPCPARTLLRMAWPLEIDAATERRPYEVRIGSGNRQAE